MTNDQELEKFIQDAVNNLLDYNSKSNDQNFIGYDQGRYDTYITVLTKMAEIRRRSELCS